MLIFTGWKQYRDPRRDKMPLINRCARKEPVLIVSTVGGLNLTNSSLPIRVIEAPRHPFVALPGQRADTSKSVYTRLDIVDAMIDKLKESMETSDERLIFIRNINNLFSMYFVSNGPMEERDKEYYLSVRDRRKAKIGELLSLGEKKDIVVMYNSRSVYGVSPENTMPTVASSFTWDVMIDTTDDSWWDNGANIRVNSRIQSSATRYYLYRWDTKEYVKSSYLSDEIASEIVTTQAFTKLSIRDFRVFVEKSCTTIKAPKLFESSAHSSIMIDDCGLRYPTNQELIGVLLLVERISKDENVRDETKQRIEELF